MFYVQPARVVLPWQNVYESLTFTSCRKNYLERLTQPAIPQDVQLADAPATWWSLVKIVSWDAWVTPHAPQIMPECNLKPPERY